MLPCCDAAPVSPTGDAEEKKTEEEPVTSEPQEPQAVEPQKDAEGTAPAEETQAGSAEEQKGSEDASQEAAVVVQSSNEQKQEEKVEDDNSQVKEKQSEEEKQQDDKEGQDGSKKLEEDKQPEGGNEDSEQEDSKQEDCEQPEDAKQAPLEAPVSPVVDEAEREERRQLAIQELIDTEQTYYGDLLVVVSIYMDPLQNNPVYSKMITPQEFRDIFSNFSTFPPLHSDLLRFVLFSQA